MEKRKSFVFFLDWQKVLKKYSMKLRCTVYDSICQYQETGEVSEKLEGEALMAFNFIKEDIDRNNAKYEKMCARRREWGKKGVAERNKKAIEKHENELQKKTTISYLKVPYATFNEKENEKENVNENGSENEKENLLNEINKNNITTTTTTTARAHAHAEENLKIKEKSNQIIFKINKDNSEYSADGLIKEFFEKGPGAEIENLTKEFGDAVNVEKLADQVINDWIRRGGEEHDSIEQCFDHMISQMRIQNNINNRKAKRNGSKSKSTAKARPRKDSEPERRTVQASDFE